MAVPLILACTNDHGLTHVSYTAMWSLVLVVLVGAGVGGTAALVRHARLSARLLRAQ